MPSFCNLGTMGKGTTTADGMSNNSSGWSSGHFSTATAFDSLKYTKKFQPVSAASEEDFELGASTPASAESYQLREEVVLLAQQVAGVRQAMDRREKQGWALITVLALFASLAIVGWSVTLYALFGRFSVSPSAAPPCYCSSASSSSSLLPPQPPLLVTGGSPAGGEAPPTQQTTTAATTTIDELQQLQQSTIASSGSGSDGSGGKTETTPTTATTATQGSSDNSSGDDDDLEWTSWSCWPWPKIAGLVLISPVLVLICVFVIAALASSLAMVLCGLAVCWLTVIQLCVYASPSAIAAAAAMCVRLALRHCCCRHPAAGQDESLSEEIEAVDATFDGYRNYANQAAAFVVRCLLIDLIDGKR